MAILDLAKHFAADELPALSMGRELRGAKELLRGVELHKAKEEKALKDRPQECPDDARKDWRYRMGAIDMAERILSLPDEAGKLLNAKGA